MAQVISLSEYRERRDPSQGAIQRLESAIARLDPLVRGRRGLSPSVESELQRIAADVGAGRPSAAAKRAERLADLLEHPAALA
jgi:hypothetical protein